MTPCDIDVYTRYRYLTDATYHATVHIVGHLLWFAFHPEELVRRRFM